MKQSICSLFKITVITIQTMSKSKSLYNWWSVCPSWYWASCGTQWPCILHLLNLTAMVVFTVGHSVWQENRFLIHCHVINCHCIIYTPFQTVTNWGENL